MRCVPQSLRLRPSKMVQVEDPTYQGKTCESVSQKILIPASYQIRMTFCKSKIIEFLWCFTNFLRKTLKKFRVFYKKTPPETIPSQKGGSFPLSPSEKTPPPAVRAWRSPAPPLALRPPPRGFSSGGVELQGVELDPPDGDGTEGRQKLEDEKHPGRLVTAICFGICRWILVSV